MIHLFIIVEGFYLPIYQLQNLKLHTFSATYKILKSNIRFIARVHLIIIIKGFMHPSINCKI